MRVQVHPLTHAYTYSYTLMQLYTGWQHTGKVNAPGCASYAHGAQCCMQAYRTKAGLDVDPEAESAAMALYEEVRTHIP